MLLKCAGELTDSSGEDQVEEELNPAGAALLAVVTVRGPQPRAAEMYCVTSLGVTC